ncbi:Exo-glucosaminidase LytG precursor [Variovorax sp. SRS16]|uniref:glycoside hydrolase family 73 protein n=1 Tax=Variovorax sp. SRS16 TaxID=282217 RepID=UPI0013181AF8|nr:glucosaminidase domain-containing protein [Variovorax sp. SRS16]VTU20122.1 Exo-glucosaminidase LytG precursor [Variovorax sp. SRS16]
MELMSVLDSLGSSAGIPASVPRVNAPADFISTYSPIAEQIGGKLGVDPKIILGQLGLETGWGKSIIPGTNNLGNIKDFSGGGTVATDNMTGSREKYRTYPTPSAFADDYASLIARKYPGALGAGTDPAAFAAGLKGYAEDPRYADKIVQATRMVGSAPGPVMNAVGNAASSLFPSANAGTVSNRTNMQSDLSPELSDLVSQYKQQPQQAQQATQSADPMDALVAQFRQAPAPAAAPASAAARQPVQDQGSMLGTAVGALSNATPVGFLVNAAVNPGMARDAVKGLASGFADVGNTIINRGTKLGSDLMTGLAANGDPLGVFTGNPGIRPPANLSSLVTGQAPQSPSELQNAQRKAGLDAYDKENDSLPFAVGRVGGNIAATAPLGGVLGAGVKGLSTLPMLSRAAPVLNALGDSITTGGFRTGLTPSTLFGQAGNLGLRSLGGGINGYTSAGVVDPAAANAGGVVGAATGPVVAGAGKVLGAAGNVARSMMTPDEVRAAQAILNAGGYKTPEEIAAVKAAIAQQGPNIVGEGPTVPQILQNPGISQLQRTLRNSGDTAILNRETAQDAARLATLDRVSPVSGTVQQAAENFGNGLTSAVRPAEAQASKQVNAAFDAVDPFNETRFNLPIDQMQAAKNKFLGDGTFGTGGKVDAALAEANRIGTETLPPITATVAPGARSQPQNIVQALQNLGGINTGTVSSRGMAGELADLRQSGLGRVMQNGRGQSLDTLASAMHAQGFIPEDDPVTLLNALRDHAAGEKVISNTADLTRSTRAGAEASMGEAPGATVIPKPVAFREMQNMRSSLGEAADQASAKGSNKEAAALRQMIAALDERTRQVAAGKGAQGEYFPTDIVQAWQDAVKLHADKMDRFHTGPQTSIFQRGGDGLPAAQGAELAPKFFNPRGSQSADIAAFRKIADPQTEAALKNYAITDAANQTNRFGNLTNAKYANWVAARTGALDGLMSDAERAQIYGVGSDLARADSAASLGMANGSNTAQNVQSALGLGMLDHPAMKAFAHRLPVVGRLTGPMLDTLRATALKGKVSLMGSLLADPGEMDKALSEYLVRMQQQPMGLLSPASLGLLRSAPVAVAAPGRH